MYCLRVRAGLLHHRLRERLDGAPPALLGRPATKAQATAAYRNAERLIGELGLEMHPTKGVNEGPTQVRLLGHIADTHSEGGRAQPHQRAVHGQLAAFPVR